MVAEAEASKARVAEGGLIKAALHTFLSKMSRDRVCVGLR